MTQVQHTVISASGSHESVPDFEVAKSRALSLVMKGEPWAEVRLGSKIVFATDASVCSCCCGG